MKKSYGTVTFSNSIKDTFPYVESAIMVLDNNFNWWKKNYNIFEELLTNEARGILKESIEISTKLIIYNGPDENVSSVKWTNPAYEFTFIEVTSDIVRQIKNKLGDTWEGHKIIANENRIIVLFE